MRCPLGNTSSPEHREHAYGVRMPRGRLLIESGSTQRKHLHGDVKAMFLLKW